jgi:hypothetical protein
MIVDPDFFDHWRTRMVADMLKDQLAPVYIMRLWAHCQNRKGDVFDIPPAGLKALCQFSGAAQELEDALVAAEYIVRDGLTVTVTGWAEKNASLLAAWENGHKGGRPKKNQNTTDGKPAENPTETHGLPMANPSLTQTKPIRVDKIREEEKTEEAPSPKSPRGTALPKDWELPGDWRTWAEGARPDVDVLSVADSFRDYWVAKPGKDGRKSDWLATWRNWVRNQRSGNSGQRPQSAATVGMFV